MVTGSNPVSGARQSKLPNTGTFKEFQNTPKPHYDTIEQNSDTKLPLRLYRVGTVYYYRRRINYKLVRISLQTKNLKEAICRKRLLDMLTGEEMFQLNTGDLKIAFEYDTEEELRTALEYAFRMQVEAKIEKFKEVKQEIEHNQHKPKELLTWESLRDIYITQKKRDGNVGQSTIEDYLNTFKKLTEYFKGKQVHTLTIDDIEAFKLHLNSLTVRGKNLSKNTINKHLGYVKNFLEFAKQRDYVERNVAEGVSLYNRKQVKKEAPKKENYSKTQIKKIINYHNYQEPIYNAIYKIAAYTGMRQGELRLIEKEDIKRDKDNILFINIPEAKSEAGERKVPVHKDIEELILNTEFPFFDLEKISKNAFGKKVRYQLKKALGEEYIDFHTIRATFIENIIEAHFNSDIKLKAVQEIVGHAGSESDTLTTQTYGKGFKLEQKKEIIDKVAY